MAKGKRIYVRAKKEQAGDGVMWPEKKRLEALTTFVATGSVSTTANLTGVPLNTINKWKQSDWWKEGIEQLQYEDNIQISSRLSKLLEKSILAVEDRLDNGEHMYDPRTGKILRIPAKLRDVHKITNDIVDKKQQLLKMHVAKEATKKEDSKTITADHLVQLAQAFAQFAKGRPMTAKPEGEMIDGEYTEVLDKLGHEEPAVVDK